MFVSAIVLAAGKGARFKAAISKPLIKINSCPTIVYCLNALDKHAKVKEIIVVANQKNLSGIISTIKQYQISKVKKVVLGGKRRQDSVLNGLISTDKKSDFVLMHDAARPFINKRNISAAIKEAQKSGAAITGVPVKATIKKVVRG